LLTAAFAEHEAQGIDQDRLAGTGFAGQDRHAAIEFDFDAVDNGEISYL